MTKRMYSATIWFHIAAENETEASEIADQVNEAIGDLTPEFPLGDSGISDIELIE